MRTQEERKWAIGKLLINKSNLKDETSFFGEDIPREINKMVDVIYNDIREEEYISKYGDSKFGAYGAVKYLNGECELEDLLYPEIDE